MSTKRNRSVRSTTAAGGTNAPKQDASGSPTETADAAISEERIRVVAYFLAERRGFGPGHELEDWLAAEEAVRAACEGSTVTWSAAPRAGARSTQRS